MMVTDRPDNFVQELFQQISERCQQVPNERSRNKNVLLLEILTSNVTELVENIDSPITEDVLQLWMTLYSILLQPNDLRQEMLDLAFDQFLAYLEVQDYRLLPNWQSAKDTILESLAQISELRDAKNSYWSSIWRFSIRILNSEVISNHALLNKFLFVVEPTLRMNNAEQCAHGYSCWQALLQFFSGQGKMSSNSVLKLIAKPFNWDDGIEEATDETVAKKFAVWWAALCSFESNVKKYTDLLLLPWLRFCFGPIKLSSDLRWTEKTIAPVQRTVEMSLNAIRCLIQLLGPYNVDEPAFEEMPMERMDKLARIIYVSRILVNSCGEVTVMLFRQMATITPNTNRDDLVALGTNLWHNLVLHLNKAMEADVLILALQNLEQLADILDKIDDASQDRANELFIVIMQMITSSSFAFKAQNANIEQSTHLTMFKMIHKMMLTFVKSQRNHADKIRIIISKICNGFCIQNCERFTALVDAIYCNVLNDTSQSSYQKANELNLFVWIELTRMITNWLIGHQETVAVWTDNNPNRLQLKLYNHLMWPLGRSMKEIGTTSFRVDWEKLAAAICSVDGNDKFIHGCTSRLSSLAHGYQYHEKLGIFVEHLMALVKTNNASSEDDNHGLLSLLKIARNLVSNPHLTESDLKTLLTSIERVAENVPPNCKLAKETRDILEIRTKTTMAEHEVHFNKNGKRFCSDVEYEKDWFEELQSIPYGAFLGFIKSKVETNSKFRVDLTDILNNN